MEPVEIIKNETESIKEEPKSNILLLLLTLLILIGFIGTIISKSR